MQQFEFNLRISPEQYVEYYRGTVRHVLVRSSNGQTIQFPAALLQKFVAKEGIHGRFRLTCDENHKSAELQRLDGPLQSGL
jgi:hypothetical protein